MNTNSTNASSMVTNIASNASTMATNIATSASTLGNNVATNVVNMATNIANVANNVKSNVSNIANNMKTNVSNIVSGTNNSATTGFTWSILFYGVLIGLCLLFIYYFQVIKEYGLEFYAKYFGKSTDDIPEEAKKDLKPSDRPSGMPGAVNPSLMETIGEKLPHRAEVFNVARNIYTYNDASAVCRAMGADLATYEQVKDAYDQGADWCNYGWVKGQMAVYPTQKETFDKLQKGPESSKGACGAVGINGGYFDNPDLRFGVNCYGMKPSKRESDAISNDIQLPKSAEEIEFDKKVQRYRDQIDEMNVLPFSKSLSEGAWSSS